MSKIGLNLRVTGHSTQGGRKYMEDVFTVAYQQTEDDMDLEYAFFGIFDGHGGKEAALFAKEHLMDNITKQQNFWSNNDDLVLKAIREGFLKTQQDMWADQENWTKTRTGFPSTAGTTASIAFIRWGKIYVGHVGDSGIVLGIEDPEDPEMWSALPLTKDHKPESAAELARIEAAGGKVIAKSGVPRVVWNRPQNGHTGPVRRSTHIDEVPFLAVARALGDLWSYNSEMDKFVVSPEPDLHVYEIDIKKQRCLVLATDGAWNVLTPAAAVSAVRTTERSNEKFMMDPDGGHPWQNPSKRIVDICIERWNSYKLRADNTTALVVMLDPPGPPRSQVLRRQKRMENVAQGLSTKKPCNNEDAPPLPPKPSTVSKPGCAIISRFPNSKKREDALGKNLAHNANAQADVSQEKTSSRIVYDSLSSKPQKIRINVNEHSSPTSQKHQDFKSSDANPLASSVEAKPESTKPIPSRKSISRELASLALSSPAGEKPKHGRVRRSAGFGNPLTAINNGDARPSLRRKSGLDPNSGEQAGVQRPKRRRGHSLESGGGSQETESGSDVENGSQNSNASTRPGQAGSHRAWGATKQGDNNAQGRGPAMERSVGNSGPQLLPATPNSNRVLRNRNCNTPTAPASQLTDSGQKRKRAEAASSMPVGLPSSKRERSMSANPSNKVNVLVKKLDLGSGGSKEAADAHHLRTKSAIGSSKRRSSGGLQDKSTPSESSRNLRRSRVSLNR